MSEINGAIEWILFLIAERKRESVSNEFLLWGCSFFSIEKMTESVTTQGHKTSKKFMYFTPKPSKTCHFLWWNGHNPACILLSPMKMKIFIKIIGCFWFFTNFMDEFDENLHFHRWKQNTCMILSVPRKKCHFFDVLCPWVISSCLTEKKERETEISFFLTE